MGAHNTHVYTHMDVTHIRMQRTETTHKSTHTYTNERTHAHTPIKTWPYLLSVPALMAARTHARTHACTHAHTHTHARKRHGSTFVRCLPWRLNGRTHAHTYTRTQNTSPYLLPVPAFTESLLNDVLGREKSSALEHSNLGKSICFSKRAMSS